MRTFALNMILAVPIYFLLPVCGPRYVFKAFPSDADSQIPHPVFLSYPPNGIPSVHFSTALLIFWFLRRWKMGRIFGAVFLLLTFLATLGLGEHYLFDLIVAVPYTFGIYRLASRTWSFSRGEAPSARAPIKEAA